MQCCLCAVSAKKINKIKIKMADQPGAITDQTGNAQEIVQTIFNLISTPA